MRVQGKRGGAVLLAVLCSCYSAGVRVDEHQARKFKAGETTYADVVRELGEPTSIVTKSDGPRSALYTYTTGSAKAATFIPIVGLFAGGADVKVVQTAFNFGADGRLVDFTTTDSALAAGVGTESRPTPRDGASVASAEPLSTTCSDHHERRCNGSSIESCSKSGNWVATANCGAQRCYNSTDACGYFGSIPCCK